MSQRIIAVTGASNGIGAELSKLLMAGGTHVIALDIEEPKSCDTYIQLDLSDPSSIQKATNALPQLDGLCNCAGLPPRDGLSAKILAVNFTGTRLFTKSTEPKLNPGAAIVNLASRAGGHWRENINQSKRLAELDHSGIDAFVKSENIDPVRAYDLSKEAMILWTMAASERISNAGNRINSVSPGAVETRIMDDFANAFGERMSRNLTRAGRAATAKEVAELAAFLLSPQSHWIKGSDIPIDGGMGAFNASDALDLKSLDS